jgi:hypothetical protein
MATITGEFGSNGRARRAGRNEMNRFYSKAAIAAMAVLGGWALMAPAHAAPPTVTPSPGYDARLQQQRAASTADVPAASLPGTAYQHRVRRRHQRALKHH